MSRAPRTLPPNVEIDPSFPAVPIARIGLTPSFELAAPAVAPSFAVRGTVDEQVAAQQSLVKAFGETYRLANSRFDKGIDSYLGVLDAQRSLFGAQQALVFLRLQKLANDVQFYAVLGGGWQPEAAPGLSAMSSSRPETVSD